MSLLPSATEIVYALGADALLVGVTFECDEPRSARVEKRVLVGGRDTSGMAPGEIDAYVRSQLAAGGDLYTLDEGAFAQLSPDVILTQDLCRVCAVSTGRVTDALEHLRCRADVVTLNPRSLEDVLVSIETVGQRLGADQQAHQLVEQLRARLSAAAARVAGRHRPRVAVLEWVDPPFAAGHWVPDLVTAAGGLPVAARPGGRSEQLDWAQVAAAEPEVVVVAPCGFHLDDAAEQALAIREHLPAGVPVWAIDADGLVVRPGPRLVDGVEALVAVLHSDVAGEPDPAAARYVGARPVLRAPR